MTPPTTMNDSNLVNAVIFTMVHQVAEAAAATVLEKVPESYHHRHILYSFSDTVMIGS